MHINSNIYEVADDLEGRQYRKEVSSTERELLRQAGIIVVYGVSDDTIAFEGAIYDELYSEKIYLTRDGPNDRHGLRKLGIPDGVIQALPIITSRFGNGSPCWRFNLENGTGPLARNVRRATFMIYEDDEPFCEGLVFYKKDLPKIITTLEYED